METSMAEQTYAIIANQIHETTTYCDLDFKAIV